MLRPGQRLRALREEFGLTIRDVETASMRIAANHSNDEFAIPLSRLSDIETKGTLPSIYRLYSLAVIFRRDIRDFLGWYGVDLDRTASDLKVIEPPKTHRCDALAATSKIELPLGLDRAFDPNKTTSLVGLIEQWGLLPLTYLSTLFKTGYTYGYIGMEDFTMFPILMPGCFVQIDEHKDKVVNGVWRSEYERPIYFVETRDGYTCSWCTVKNDQLILQPHPLSPVPVRVLAWPHDAEVVGQVVGVAMKLRDLGPCQPGQDCKEASEMEAK